MVRLAPKMAATISLAAPQILDGKVWADSKESLRILSLRLRLNLQDPEESKHLLGSRSTSSTNDRSFIVAE